VATVPISPASPLGSLKKTVRSCSHCGSDEIYRQRPRGLIERHIFRAFHFAPYWCAACDKRFYLRHTHTPHRQN
jgi:DNA-directed RNA polymerase subunit RPC12/RpoP